MSQIVAVDIGGTHVRFAVAEVKKGLVAVISQPTVLRTAEHADLQSAWRAFSATRSDPLPRAAAIAIACPVRGDVLTMTNSSWIIEPALLGTQLDVDRHLVINDFVAVAHAVAQVRGHELRHICGPYGPLPKRGIVSVIGPGTGLGVAQLVLNDGSYQVISTEGGHLDFAPLDAVEDAILADLRKIHGRVSIERIVSGPGLTAIYASLARLEGRSVVRPDDKDLWELALAGHDELATAALERLCLSLGSVAGDFALATGPTGIVIAGGVGLRLADRLASSGFVQRFAAKGRFQNLMQTVPVKLIITEQPGLFGAAAAFAKEFSDDH